MKCSQQIRLGLLSRLPEAVFLYCAFLAIPAPAQESSAQSATRNQTEQVISERSGSDRIQGINNQSFANASIDLSNVAPQPEQFRVRQLSNVPDDIGYQLQEAGEENDSLFPAGPLTPSNDLFGRVTKRTKEAIGLDLGMNYTTVYQRADTTQAGPRDATDGDFDFLGRWNLLDGKNRRTGALVFSSESRHRLSDIPPANLNTGTVGGTIVGFGVQNFSLVQLYWERGSFDDGLLYRIGKMDPALIFDGGRYVSSNYAFLSPGFSDTLPMPLPGAGLGVAGAIYPTKSTYIVAGIHDANGKRTTSGFNTFFAEGEFFTAVELGWFPNEKEPNEGMYHITAWNIDARPNAGKQSDRGVAMTLEQQLGTKGNLVPFLRYAYAHRGINGIRQNLSIGVGIEEVLRQNDNLIGMAYSWGEPADDSLSEQQVFEIFYRIQVSPNTHLTPDIQIVLDPANAPGKEAVTLFGFRFRTLY